MRALVLIALLASACSLRLTRPQHVVDGRAMVAPPSPECTKLSDKVLGLNLTAIIAGAVGSGSATGAGIFGDVPAAKYALAGSAAGFSLLGAITSYLGGFFSARYTKECQ